MATSAIPVAGPLIAGVGTALLVGDAVSEITDGLFDGMGYTIGEVIDDVVDRICDFVGELFWWV